MIVYLSLRHGYAVPRTIASGACSTLWLKTVHRTVFFTRRAPVRRRQSLPPSSPSANPPPPSGGGICSTLFFTRRAPVRRSLFVLVVFHASRSRQKGDCVFSEGQKPYEKAQNQSLHLMREVDSPKAKTEGETYHINKRTCADLTMHHLSAPSLLQALAFPTSISPYFSALHGSCRPSPS